MAAAALDVTQVYERIAEVAPAIAARAGEIEAARRVPRDLLDLKLDTLTASGAVVVGAEPELVMF